MFISSFILFQRYIWFVQPSAFVVSDVTTRSRQSKVNFAVKHAVKPQTQQYQTFLAQIEPHTRLPCWHMSEGCLMFFWNFLWMKFCHSAGRLLLLLLSFIVGHKERHIFCFHVCLVAFTPPPSSSFLWSCFVRGSVGNDCAFKCCLLSFFLSRRERLSFGLPLVLTSLKHKKKKTFLKVLYYSPPQLPDVKIIIICTLGNVRLLSFCIMYCNLACNHAI